MSQNDDPKNGRYLQYRKARRGVPVGGVAYIYIYMYMHVFVFACSLFVIDSCVCAVCARVQVEFPSSTALTMRHLVLLQNESWVWTGGCLMLRHGDS